MIRPSELRRNEKTIQLGEPKYGVKYDEQLAHARGKRNLRFLAGCTSLRNRNPEGLKFCTHYGTPLKSMARCAKCGFDNAPGARFCGECGGGLSAAVQAKSLDIDQLGLLPDSQDLALLCPR